jgi:hypothetical protein
MTRNWIELAPRTVRIVEPRRVRPRPRRGWGLGLESLEARLALSSYSAGSLHADINPQPLPPGLQASPMINPQPLPPGRAIDIIVALTARGHENSNKGVE